MHISASCDCICAPYLNSSIYDKCAQFTWGCLVHLPVLFWLGLDPWFPPFRRLGMDAENDKDLMWIARAGLKAVKKHLVEVMPRYIRHEVWK